MPLGRGKRYRQCPKTMPVAAAGKRACGRTAGAETGNPAIAAPGTPGKPQGSARYLRCRLPRADCSPCLRWTNSRAALSASARLT